MKNGERYMESNSQLFEKAIYNQIEEAYAKVMYTYTTQIIHAGRLKKRSNVLKWILLILSALSTGGFIGTLVTDQTIMLWISGLCSTVILVLTSYFKDQDLFEKYTTHYTTANKLWLMRERYLSLLTDFSIMSHDEIIKQRDILIDETSKIYDEAPLTDEKSYKRAQKALKKDESQFFSRKEINLMLPEVLRK